MESEPKFMVITRDNRGKWKHKRAMFARPMSRQEADECAFELDQQGNDARVVPFKW